MPSPYTRELLEFSKDQIELKNMEIRDDLQRRVTSLASALLLPEDDIVEALPSGNRILLLAGEFPGATLRKPDGLLEGVPGTKFTSALNIYSDYRIVGVDFTSKTILPLVNVAATSNPVVFHNCKFSKTAGVGGDYVTILAGAKVIFSCCLFDGVQTSGTVVNNAGAAPDVGMIGTSNTTGVAHSNVTIVYEI